MELYDNDLIGYCVSDQPVYSSFVLLNIVANGICEGSEIFASSLVKKLVFYQHSRQLSEISLPAGDDRIVGKTYQWLFLLSLKGKINCQ